MSAPAQDKQAGKGPSLTPLRQSACPPSYSLKSSPPPEDGQGSDNTQLRRHLFPGALFGSCPCFYSLSYIDDRRVCSPAFRPAVLHCLTGAGYIWRPFYAFDHCNGQSV